jgi:uroporphyrinogen decarboxylase
MFVSKRKPNFERLVKTLYCGKADAVPLLELGFHPLIKSAVLNRQWKDIRGDIDFMNMLGYDYVKIQPGITFNLNRQTALGKAGANVKDPDRSWSAETVGVINTWEDFEKYPWPRKEDIDYSRFEIAREHLPEGMGIIGQYGDIFTTVWEMMGFESFAVATFEQPDLVQALFDKVGELILSMFDTMADMEDVGVLWYSDDIAYANGLMLSPEFYRQYFFPLLKRIGNHTQRRKIPFIYHTDGFLWDVFDDFIDCGVNAIHPIEPKAMEIKEVKEKRGHQFCICGGIDLDLLSRGTPEQVGALTSHFIRELAYNGGYCAGSSNSIPEYVKVENLIAMVQTVHDEGVF